MVAFAASASAVVPTPYGYNDAGGFRNVLPPGENGLDNLQQLFKFRGTEHLLPPHFSDQQPLYENLVYGAPTLTDGQIPSYFKDATFGVPAGEVESTIEPEPGVTIIRDKAYGIPHIYGETRAATEFGAGYAGAQDRLFLMDVLRHTGRAELASFLGGSNAEADASQWQFAPYTEADLEKQLTDAPKIYGKKGAQAVEDLNNYVAGINAYIAAANANPALKPAEYTLLSQANGTVESDRRGRDRLAGRRHLRPRRRQRAELGADDAVLRRNDGQEEGRARLARLPREERPGSADDDRQAVPLRDRSRLRQARPGAAGQEQRPRRKGGQRLRRGRRRRTGSEHARRPGAGLARSCRARLELGAGQQEELGQRPPAGGDGAAGRLLHPADPDGRGPARPGDRRPRRRLRRGQPLRRARPRPRLRLERDHRDLRQRRHLRRGPLQGPASTTCTRASAWRWKS